MSQPADSETRPSPTSNRVARPHRWALAGLAAFLACAAFWVLALYVIGTTLGLLPA